MKELSERTKLMLWDSAFVITTVLYFLLHTIQPLIGWLLLVMCMITVRNSIKSHISAYKLSGKIY